MGIYISSISTPHRTLTERERRQLLKSRESGATATATTSSTQCAGHGTPRARVVQPRVGDVFEADGTAKTRIVLRVFKRSSSAPTQQEVIVPEDLRTKLEKFRGGKRGNAKASQRTPLSLQASGHTLSTRQIRHGFAVWQRRADSTAT